MTALAGYWVRQGSRDAADACASMLSAQACYANRSPVVLAHPSIALGASSFSSANYGLDDEAVIGSFDSGYALCADVRLDNRLELLSFLAPHSKNANLSDNELLLELLVRHGEKIIDHLRGDFSFAFWNAHQHVLLLARDFLGQRPMHYVWTEEHFAFSSMPKGLGALQDRRWQPDLRTVAKFLAFGPENNEGSFFEGVSKVPPGHYLAVGRERMRLHRYWRPELLKPFDHSTDGIVEVVRETFDRAVQRRLRGHNGVIAAHLSGGLDSGSVVATAAQMLDLSSERILAFTAVPRDGFQQVHKGVILDERYTAARVANAHRNIEHILVSSGSQSPLENLQRSFALYQRPVLNLVNLVWLESINAELQRRGISILLTGARGNMTFSYSGMPLLTRLFSSGRLTRLTREALALRARGVNFSTIGAQAIGPLLPIAIWKLIQAVRGRAVDLAEMTPLRRSAIDEMDLLSEAHNADIELDGRPVKDGCAARLWMLRGVDYGNYNKGALAGWGVDVRDPTADRDLVELCLSIPDQAYLVDGQTRYLARAAMADRMPPETLKQSVKGYQAADWLDGFVRARDEVLKLARELKDCRRASAIMDTDRLLKLAESAPTEPGVASMQHIQKYRLILLRGLAAGAFIKFAESA